MVDDNARNAWLAERKNVLTATDIAAILTGKGLAVWLDKKDMNPPLEENEYMKRGLQLQPVILDIYEEETGQSLTRYENVLTVSKVVPTVGASLDAQWTGGDMRPVDAKNVDRYQRQFWGEQGTDDIPRHILIQIVVQMHVTDAECGDVAALFGGNTFGRYTVKRDHELEEIVLEQAGEWWERHIVRGEQPDLDGSEQTSKWLSKRFAQSTGLVIPPKPEHYSYAARIARIKAFEKRMAEERARCENELKNAIGAAEGLEGLATWKFDKEGTVLDKDGYIDELERIVNRLPGGLGKISLQQMREQFTKPKPPTRRFLLKEVNNGRQ